jgi:hypothetical protein
VPVGVAVGLRVISPKVGTTLGRLLKRGGRSLLGGTIGDAIGRRRQPLVALTTGDRNSRSGVPPSCGRFKGDVGGINGPLRSTVRRALHQVFERLVTVFCRELN